MQIIWQTKKLEKQESPLRKNKLDIRRLFDRYYFPSQLPEMFFLQIGKLLKNWLIKTKLSYSNPYLSAFQVNKGQFTATLKSEIMRKAK